MVSKMRAQRIGDRIFEELSTLLLMEVSDPRLSGVAITEVRVDRELAFANIYISALEGIAVADEILAGLRHAGGFLRRELAQRIQLRHFPRLRFYWDSHPEQADYIDQLLDSLPDGSSPPPTDAEDRT